MNIHLPNYLPTFSLQSTFAEKIFLTAQQKKIVLIAALVLGALAACYYVVKNCLGVKRSIVRVPSPSPANPEVFKECLGLLDHLRDPQQNPCPITLAKYQVNLPNYEFYGVSQTVQDFAKLNEHFEEFKESAWDQANPAMWYSLFNGKSTILHNIKFGSLLFHLEDGAPSLIARAEECLHIFEKQYEFHKEKGTLSDFFKEAFVYGCFDHQARHLQSYHSTHPVEDESDVPNLNLIADYSRESCIYTIFQEELRIYNEKKRIQAKLEAAPTAKFEEFKKYLLEEVKIIGLEGVDWIGAIPRKITLNDIDIKLQYLKEIYLLE